MLLLLTLLPGLAWKGTRVDFHPQYADTVNRLAKPGDTVWLAPAEFYDWLFIEADNAAAPYYFVYPWTLADETIESDLMAKLAANRPAVIVYRRDVPVGLVVGLEPVNFAPDLTAWVDARYVAVAEDVYIRRDE